jgi:membrane protein YqaA with SNARE-associated domain
VNGSLWAALAVLFVDGATFGIATTPALLEAGKAHSPWALALAGGLASALGSMVQLRGLRWLLNSGHAWARRWAPSQEKLAAALARYREATFLGLVLVRATPVPDLPLKLVAAAGRYPIPLYGLAAWLGSLPYYYLLAKLGATFRPPLWAVLAGVALVGLVGLWDRSRRRGPRGRTPPGGVAA